MPRHNRFPQKEILAGLAAAAGPLPDDLSAADRSAAKAIYSGKYGFLARAIIPPTLARYESLAAFEELLVNLHRHLAPADGVELEAVGEIASCHWRLRRVARARRGTAGLLESGAITVAQHDADILGYDRYERHLRRLLRRALATLADWQHRRSDPASLAAADR